MRNYQQRCAVLTMALFCLLLAPSRPAWATDIYVSTFSDSYGQIYKIDSEIGAQTVIASGLTYPEDIAIDINGIMYIGGFFSGVRRIDITSGARLPDVGTNICGPEGPSIDNQGDVYFNTRGGPCGHSGVWKIEDGTATTATQVIPPFSEWGEGTAFLTEGTFAGCLIASDSTGYRVVRSCPPDFGTASTFITTGALTLGLAVNSMGDVFVSIYPDTILRYSPEGESQGIFASGLDFPIFMEFDEADNLYLAESFANHVMKISPEGVKTILASGLSLSGPPGGIAIPPRVKKLTNVRVIDTVSMTGVVVDPDSFTMPPSNITEEADRTIIEWQFDTFSIGQIENLSFDVTLKNPIPGEDRLVNHKLEALYTDVNGNPVRTELGPQFVHVLTSAFNPTVSTDKTRYAANENLLIDLSIINLSKFAQTVDAVVEIEDNAGNLVQSVTTLSELTFTAGETKTFLDLIYNTGTTIASEYRVHVRLIKAGTQVGEAFANFTIIPAISISSKVTTDKIAYQAHEPITITSQIQSSSPNHIFQNLVAKVSVHDPSGQILFTDEQPIPILTPGQIVQFKTYGNSAINPAGQYPVTLEVLEGTTVLSASTAVFGILSSTATGAGLSGTLFASPNPVFQGKEETLSYTVTNNGNEDLSNLQVNLLIVDPDTQEVKQTLQATINLSMNTTHASNFIVSTRTLIPKIYMAVLQGLSASMSAPKTLASATFNVAPGLEVTKTIPDVTNLLVWVNDHCKRGKDHQDKTERDKKDDSDDDNDGDNDDGDDDGDRHNRCLRVDLLEKILKEAVARYKIVYDKKDFQMEIRNPYYTDMMVLGDHHHLENHYFDEMKEQIYGGKGLLSSLFFKDGKKNPIFDFRVKGHLPGDTHKVILLDTPLSGADTLNAIGQAKKVQVNNLDNVVALIQDNKQKQYPAIVLDSYGLGKMIFYAFDLGLTLNDENDNQIATLIKNSLAYIHKKREVTGFDPYQLVPVAITLKSLGGGFDLRMIESYPPDLKLYDPVTGQWVTDNPWITHIHLDPDETKTILYYALMPDKSGTYTPSTEVGYIEEGNYNFYQRLTIEIVVDKETKTMAGDIISALEGLSVAGHDRAKVMNAIKYIAAVQARTIRSQRDIVKNIHETLKAIESLLSVTGIDISDIRLMMDRLLVVWEGRWSLGSG